MWCLEKKCRAACTLRLGYLSACLLWPLWPHDALAAPPAELALAAFVRKVVEQSPQLRVSRLQAELSRVEAGRAAALPEPELMLEVWQIPIRRPYALDAAGMVELGLKQHIPAPGSLGRREQALRHVERQVSELGQTALREVGREAAHAFVDYASAGELQTLHVRHHLLIARLHESAAQTFVTAGSPLDSAKVGIESGRVEAEIAQARARVDAARSRMNALLGEPPDAELGAALLAPPHTVSVSSRDVVGLARRRRPELRAARARVDAERSSLAAAEREASVPSFDLAALYFPALGMQREHGYGVSAAMSLPWLWGARRAEAEVATVRRAVAGAESRARTLAVTTEALTAFGETAASAARLRTLLVRVKPLIEHQVELAEARIVTGAAALPMVVEAWRASVEVDAEIAMARAELDHALIELEWAAGGPLPKVPLLPSSPASLPVESP